MEGWILLLQETLAVCGSTHSQDTLTKQRQENHRGSRNHYFSGIEKKLGGGHMTPRLRVSAVLPEE